MSNFTTSIVDRTEPRPRDPSTTCAHCGAEHCADHCPAAPDGEHDPRIDGPRHLSYHGDDATTLDGEIVCAACGAQGHTLFVVGMDDPDDDLLDDVRWDSPGSM